MVLSKNIPQKDWWIEAEKVILKIQDFIADCYETKKYISSVKASPIEHQVKTVVATLKIEDDTKYKIPSGSITIHIETYQNEHAVYIYWKTSELDIDFTMLANRLAVNYGISLSVEKQENEDDIWYVMTKLQWDIINIPNNLMSCPEILYRVSSLIMAVIDIESFCKGEIDSETPSCSDTSLIRRALLKSDSDLDLLSF